MKYKKKLCFVIPTHWSAMMGGTEYQAKCLLDKLVSEGQYEIYYLARRHGNQFHPEGYQIYRIPSKNALRRYGFFFDVFGLLKLLHKIQPDVIYQRNGCAYTGIAAFYAKEKRCKMVWHIASDNNVLPFPKQFSPKSILLRIDKKILEYGIRACDSIIAQTHKQAEYLKKHYGRTPTAVIRNFHPLPQRMIKKDDPVKIVWIANFKPLKQPEYFIKLAKNLENIKPKIQCIMIGAPSNGYPKWQRSLERKIMEIEHLEYLGPRPIEEVNSILAKAHILVNTSLFEGFPNTFIQAWMRKVPVISLHINPDKIFDKHKVGYFSGNYEKMLESTIELIRNPELRNGQGLIAYKYAVEKHSEMNINNLINLF